jgi:hypothetical protein
MAAVPATEMIALMAALPAVSFVMFRLTDRLLDCTHWKQRILNQFGF